MVIRHEVMRAIADDCVCQAVVVMMSGTRFLMHWVLHGNRYEIMHVIADACVW